MFGPASTEWSNNDRSHSAADRTPGVLALLVIDSCCTVAVDAADPHALREVRTLFRRHMDVDDGWSGAVDDALLLACELVGNVYRHCVDRHCLLRLSFADRLRVEVHDRSPLLPELAKPDPFEESGRGLALVDGLACAWGADRLPGGKRVWFELHRAAIGSPL